MRVKEESEKASWKLNIKKTKIMTSGPITSWQMEEEKVEVVIDFIFLGSKITVDSDCDHEIKRYLLLGRKIMTNLDSVLKSRHITLLTRVGIVKAMVFFSSHVWTEQQQSRLANILSPTTSLSAPPRFILLFESS